MEATTQDWVNTALGAGALMGGVGYAIGQFFSSRRRGLSETLKTALDEIEAEKLAKERAAKTAMEKADELAATKLEVSALRNALTQGGGEALTAEIIKAIGASTREIKALLREEHAKLRELLEGRQDAV